MTHKEISEMSKDNVHHSQNDGSDTILFHLHPPYTDVGDVSGLPGVQIADFRSVATSDECVPAMQLSAICETRSIRISNVPVKNAVVDLTLLWLFAGSCRNHSTDLSDSKQRK